MFSILANLIILLHPVVELSASKFIAYISRYSLHPKRFAYEAFVPFSPMLLHSHQKAAVFTNNGIPKIHFCGKSPILSS
jgi:hypothetical protein